MGKIKYLFDYSNFATVAPFFLSSFFWNVALGMTYILIPLYARSLGMSGVQIGTMIALPVTFQIGFTLLGGALIDRAGGKNTAMIAYVLTCISGAAFMASASFVLMFAAQLIMVVARSIFWPATWALAGDLPGEPAKQFGRLNAATNAGQFAGTAVAGFIIVHTGYRFGFGSMVAAGLMAILLIQIYPIAATMRRASTDSAYAIYRKLFRKRTIRYGMLCSYISALPISLSFSFYPILLVEQGFDFDITGLLMSLRAAGAIAAGLVAGYLIPHIRGIATPLISASAVGLMVILGAAVSQPIAIGIFLFILGVGSATMLMYAQMLIVQATAKAVRGSAMALINAGWCVSLFTTPLFMGALNDLFGIQTAFCIMGAFTLTCALALIPLQHWALIAESELSADCLGK